MTASLGSMSEVISTTDVYLTILRLRDVCFIVFGTLLWTGDSGQGVGYVSWVRQEFMMGLFAPASLPSPLIYEGSKTTPGQHVSFAQGII